jgi:hypothetical protein
MGEVKKKVHTKSGKVQVAKAKNTPENRKDTKIVAVICLSDDMFTELHHYEDPQCQMTDSEIMTTRKVIETTGSLIERLLP